MRRWSEWDEMRSASEINEKLIKLICSRYTHRNSYIYNIFHCDRETLREHEALIWNELWDNTAEIDRSHLRELKVVTVKTVLMQFPGKHSAVSTVHWLGCSSYQSVTGISHFRGNQDRKLINWIKLEHKAGLQTPSPVTCIHLYFFFLGFRDHAKHQ